MSESNVEFPYSDRHVLRFAAHGASSAEIEMEAFQRAGNYFGLLAGDKITEFLFITIDASPAIAVDGNEAGGYEAHVMARPR